MIGTEQRTTSEADYEAACARFNDIASRYNERAAVLRAQLDILSAEWDEAHAALGRHELTGGISMWRHLLRGCPDQTCKCRSYTLEMPPVYCTHELDGQPQTRCGRTLQQVQGKWSHVHEPFFDIGHEGRPDLASCGHTRNEDGECNCAWWPERAPVGDGPDICRESDGCCCSRCMGRRDPDSWVYQ